MRKVSLILAFCMVAAGPVFAQGATKPKAAVTAKPAATAATPEVAAAAADAARTDDRPKAIVAGFRSAKFGMNEADIRAAISKDFGAKPDAIKTQDNPAELTHSLLVTVPDLLANGGTAEVSYVLGYKSKTLIQVGTVWSKTSDAAITPERLFSNANILRAHFLNEGFKPDTVAVNTPVNCGLPLFRGIDAKDHTVMLLLQGTFETKEINQRIPTPTGLLLFYVPNAQTPALFKF